MEMADPKGRPQDFTRNWAVYDGDNNVEDEEDNEDIYRVGDVVRKRFCIKQSKLLKGSLAISTEIDSKKEWSYERNYLDLAYRDQSTSMQNPRRPRNRWAETH